MKVAKLFLFVVLFLTSCATPATPGPDPITPSDTLAPLITEGGHIEKISGVVQIGEPGNLHEPSAGETLQFGEHITTGRDSATVIELIDGSKLIVNENSDLQLVSLDIASEAPILHLRLEHGQVFAVTVKQKLGESTPSLFEIEWGGETGAETAIRTIRSSPNREDPYRNFKFSLAYDPLGGNSQATCLQGECLLTDEGEEFTISEGQVLEVRTAPVPNIPPLPGMNPGVFLTTWSQDNGSAWLGALEYAGVDATLFSALPLGGEGDPSPYPFTLAYRSATVHKITGDIVERPAKERYGETRFEALTVGDVVVHGETVRTGPDSGVVLELDDGTLVVLNEDTVLDLNELGGTVDAPTLNFMLERGEIFLVNEGTLHEGARTQITLADGVVVDLRNGSEDGHLGLNLAYYADTDDFVITVLGGQVHVTDGEQTADLTASGHLHGRIKVHFPWLSEASLTEHDASLWLWALDFAEKNHGNYSSLKTFEETEHPSSPSLEPHHEEASH